tara:strand:+ start:115 stop:957 length:843 start_codon:yes stop_codon:yes gene_type:complete
MKNDSFTMKTLRFTHLPFLITLTLIGCGGEVLPDLPTGEQAVAGILRPAELSAVRRGSHIIEQENTAVYYAESSLINLRSYLNKRVTLRGRFEHNTDPQDLPVLVVESVVDVEETTKEHSLSKISVRLEAPVHWKLVERAGKYQFRLEEDEGDPLLVVWQETGELLPDGGVPIVVDATRATRLIDEFSNTQLVAVKRSGTILHIRFAPGSRLSADRLQEDFLALLKSIDLIDKNNGDPDPSFGTGSLSSPCGGAAGILCPTGYFCDIQDFEENIGRCRKL